MKKHDEGYALVFVLVVMVVLSLVATTLMTGALKNLQAQNASIERMEAKYVAEGMVEVTLLTLETKLSSYSPGLVVTDPKNVNEGIKQPILKAVEGYLKEAKVQSLKMDEDDQTLTWTIEWMATPNNAEEHNHSLVVTIKATSGVAHTEYSVVLNDIIQYQYTVSDENHSKNEKWCYAQPVISYQGYQISYDGGGS